MHLQRDNGGRSTMFSAQDRTEESHSRFAKNPETAGLSMAPAQMGVGHRAGTEKCTVCKRKAAIEMAFL
jgi:hypothetical protein